MVKREHLKFWTAYHNQIDSSDPVEEMRTIHQGGGLHFQEMAPLRFHEDVEPNDIKVYCQVMHNIQPKDCRVKLEHIEVIYLTSKDMQTLHKLIDSKKEIVALKKDLKIE